MRLFNWRRLGVGMVSRLLLCRIQFGGCSGGRMLGLLQRGLSVFMTLQRSHPYMPSTTILPAYAPVLLSAKLLHSTPFLICICLLAQPTHKISQQLLTPKHNIPILEFPHERLYPVPIVSSGHVPRIVIGFRRPLVPRGLLHQARLAQT